MLDRLQVPVWLRLAVTPLLGGLAALGLAPYGWWFITLGCILALWALLGGFHRALHVTLASWFFAVGYFAFGLRWIMEPFQVEADIFGWMAPFALALMAGGLGLFWALAGWVGHRIGGGLAFAVTFALAEVLRAYIFTGFPWAGLAQIWADTPWIGVLRWVGPHGLGFITLLLPALVLVKWRPIWRVSSVLLLLSVTSITAVQDRLPQPADPQSFHKQIRIVQPNAPQHEKWDPQKWETFFWRQVEATRAGEPPDLVIWPETAIPYLLENAEPALEIIVEAARGAPVVLGVQRHQDGQYFNSLVVIDEIGAVSAIYDKHHLVPFGEYMPFAAAFRHLGIRALAERTEGGYTPGQGPTTIQAGSIRALPLICYEAIFPQHSRSFDARPDMLLQITNDAWFGNYAGPQQHLAQARMRAVEQGLPLVRSANTGISAMIDARGKIVGQLEQDRHGAFDLALPYDRPPGLYARLGDGPFAALLLLGVVLLGIRSHVPKTQ